MTYVKHRHAHRRQRDILNLALKNLWAGDELICTERTYGRIKDRVDAFRSSRQDKRIDIIPWGNLRKIRRTI